LVPFVPPPPPEILTLAKVNEDEETEELVMPKVKNPFRHPLVQKRIEEFPRRAEKEKKQAMEKALLRKKKYFEDEIKHTKSDYNAGFLACLKLMVERHKTLRIRQHEMCSATSIIAPKQILKSTEPGPCPQQLLPKVVKRKKKIRPKSSPLGLIFKPVERPQKRKFPVYNKPRVPPKYSPDEVPGMNIEDPAAIHTVIDEVESAMEVEEIQKSKKVMPTTSEFFPMLSDSSSSSEDESVESDDSPGPDVEEEGEGTFLGLVDLVSPDNNLQDKEVPQTLKSFMLALEEGRVTDEAQLGAVDKTLEFLLELD